VPIAVPVIGAIAAFATGSKNPDELFDKMFSQASDGAFIFGLITFFYMIALGISIIKSLFTYYNFKVSADEAAIKIEYGLFHKKNLHCPRVK